MRTYLTECTSNKSILKIDGERERTTHGENHVG